MGFLPLQAIPSTGNPDAGASAIGRIDGRANAARIVCPQRSCE
jgi:hypothetical protein